MFSIRRWLEKKTKSVPQEIFVARSSALKTSIDTPMTVPDTAEFYIQALDNGLIEVADVIAWADNIILQEESPELSIIEVSMSASKAKYEVFSALSAVAVGADLELVQRKILLRMAEKLAHEPEYLPLVISYLYWKAGDNEITDEGLRAEIYELDDQLEYSASRPMNYQKIAPEFAVLLTNYATRL